MGSNDVPGSEGQVELGELIDSALQEAATTESRSVALAAFASATAGINAAHPAGYALVPEVATTDLESGLSSSEIMSLRSPLEWWRDRRNSDELQERLKRYFDVADRLAKQFGPNQMQVSAGFPLIVTVTLVWNLKE